MSQHFGHIQNILSLLNKQTNKQKNIIVIVAVYIMLLFHADFGLRNLISEL